MKILPGIGKGPKRLRAFSTQQFFIRKNEGSGKKDLFYYLVGNSKPSHLVFLIFSLTCSFPRLMKQALRNIQYQLPSPSRMPVSSSLQVRNLLRTMRDPGPLKLPARIRHYRYGSLLSVLLSPPRPEEVRTTSSGNRQVLFTGRADHDGAFR